MDILRVKVLNLQEQSWIRATIAKLNKSHHWLIGRGFESGLFHLKGKKEEEEEEESTVHWIRKTSISNLIFLLFLWRGILSVHNRLGKSVTPIHSCYPHLTDGFLGTHILISMVILQARLKKSVGNCAQTFDSMAKVVQHGMCGRRELQVWILLWMNQVLYLSGEG